MRGKINEPKNVHTTAKFIAEKLGVDDNYFHDLTRENTKRVYYKIKK